MGKLKDKLLREGRDPDPHSASQATPQGYSTTRQGSNAQVTPRQRVTVSRSQYAAETAPPGQLWRIAMRAVRQGALIDRTGKFPVVRWMMFNAKRWPCSAPVLIRTVSHGERPRREGGRMVRGASAGSAQVECYGRCRECAGCLSQRRALWLARTLTEQHACQGRTWFVTLTSGDHHREFINLKARALAHKARKNFDSLSPVAQFDFRARALRREISLYLKRVRKGVGPRDDVKLRFVAVIEPHKDFQAHCHLLVFEQVDLCLSKRALCDRWKARGFSGAKLVSGAAAAYVSKYLGKNKWAQVHASLHFGNPETAYRDSGAHVAIGKREQR